MKRIIILARLVLFLVGCKANVEEKVLDTESVVISEDASSTLNYEVRLLSEGFDTDEVTIKEDTSLTIVVVDDIQHYLAIDGQRISKNSLKI